MQAIQKALHEKTQEHTAEELADAVKSAVADGWVAGCTVLEVPYAFDGMLKPVKLLTQH